MVTSPQENHDLRNAWLCAGIVLAVIALTIPIAECGVNDDWSYTKTALDLANSGHLLYNGWATAMLGAQAYWGALFIKLFGFSFLVVRLSVAPVAAGCAALLYVLHRRASLAPGLALAGTLTIVLSPVFIPAATTFMTDIPALFLFLVSIYGYVRAAETLELVPSDAGAFGTLRLWGWLLVGLAGGLLGGTVRQFVWFVPILCSSFLLLRYRQTPRLRTAIVPLVITGLVSMDQMLILLAWFQDQPYALGEKVSFSLLLSREGTPAFLAHILAIMLQTTGLLMLPLLITLPVLYRQKLAGLSSPRLRLGIASILAFFIWWLGWRCNSNTWFIPWLDDTVGILPYMYGAAPVPPHSTPRALPVHAWQAASLTVTALVCGALALGILTRVWARRTNTDTLPRSQGPVVIGLLAVSSAAYAFLLLFQRLMTSPFILRDRYLIIFLPYATIGFLKVFRRWTGRTRIPLASWLLLSVLCFYGVAQAHDYFAQLRARVTATGFLEEHGIPRTRIMAGFEYDAWTQLIASGHYNDPRIKKPAGIYVPYVQSPSFVTVYDFWPYTPAVHPDYVVSLARHPELSLADVPPTDYECWFPPLHRQLIIQVRNPALSAVGRLAVRPAAPK